MGMQLASRPLTKTPSEAPAAWPRYWPRRDDCKPEQAAQLDALAHRIPAEYLTPPWCAGARLRDPKRWSRLEVPVYGMRAGPLAKGALVTTWMWALMNGPLPGLRLNVKLRPDGSRFLIPVHSTLSKLLRENGVRTSTGISAAAMFAAAAGFDNWDGRARLLNRDPSDLRIFNLACERFPLTPEGEDARRAWLGFRLTQEVLHDHYCNRKGEE